MKFVLECFINHVFTFILYDLLYYSALISFPFFSFFVSSLHYPIPSSPSGPEAPFEIKSKNGISSLAGSLIQIRLSVRTFAVALHADSDILTVAFPSINGPLSTTQTPKKAPKGEIGHFSEDYEMLDYMMRQNYTVYSPPVTPQKDPESTYSAPRTENPQGAPVRSGR
jgi:hypothetical protein